MIASHNGHTPKQAKPKWPQVEKAIDRIQYRKHILIANQTKHTPASDITSRDLFMMDTTVIKLQTGTILKAISVICTLVPFHL